MLDLIYFLLCLLSIINVDIKGQNSFYYDYMELDSANYVKGIFVWMIFFRHFIGYFKRKDILNKISLLIIDSLDQNVVSLFLFYSGYGINESYKKKGITYIKNLPKKSLILFIKSQIAILFFLLNNILLGIKTSLKRYFLAIIFKEGIGNSYWFNFTIILLYLYSFFSFILIKNNNFFSIIFINIICYFHIILVFKYYHRNIIYSVDTIICFNIGLYYSLFKFYIDKFIMNNDIYYFGNLLLFILAYYNFYIAKREHIYNIILKNGAFTLISIIFTMKIKLKNEFLNLLSNHSFSIYLFQRLVMLHILKKGYFENHIFIKFIFEFLLVIFIAIIFDKYTKFIDNTFKKKIIKNKYNKIII